MPTALDCGAYSIRQIGLGKRSAGSGFR